MKAITAELQAHLDGELTTLATLVKITRADGVAMGFASCDQDVTYAGVTYRADGAFTPSAIQSTSGLATDNLELTGMLSSGAISDGDIAAGLYDHARIDVYICNWADISQGALPLRRGWIGEVTRAGDSYVAELRGMHDLLQRPVGAVCAPECRHDLGDAMCGVALSALTVTGSVTGVVDSMTFSDSSRTEDSGRFAYGKMTWTSGANAGVSRDVRSWNLASWTFALRLPLPHGIEIGDAYSVTPGCDKRFATCKAKFANGINFGGFPHVPGVGNILKYPDAH
ncbi:MAG: DUF2163 domain-containing protein [Bdellovibrionales bacterium]